MYISTIDIEELVSPHWKKKKKKKKSFFCLLTINAKQIGKSCLKTITLYAQPAEFPHNKIKFSQYYGSSSITSNL